ncbi:MAG: hypothetical protein V1887_00850 [Candidatus Aenigmatarchaeota archaeon]
MGIRARIYSAVVTPLAFWGGWTVGDVTENLLRHAGVYVDYNFFSVAFSVAAAYTVGREAYKLGTRADRKAEEAENARFLPPPLPGQQPVYPYQMQQVPPSPRPEPGKNPFDEDEKSWANRLNLGNK